MEAASFNSLGELELHRVLSFSPAAELLTAALVSRTVAVVARADSLWTPHCAAQHAAFPLAATPAATGSKDPDAPVACHPACRLTLARMLGLKVSALRTLAKSVDVDARELATCSEKDEICRLIHAKQASLALESKQRHCLAAGGGGGGGGDDGSAAAQSASAHQPRGYFGEREWGDAGIGSYYSGKADLKRRHCFAHELAGCEWGMFFRNREAEAAEVWSELACKKATGSLGAIFTWSRIWPCVLYC